MQQSKARGWTEFDLIKDHKEQAEKFLEIRDIHYEKDKEGNVIDYSLHSPRRFCEITVSCVPVGWVEETDIPKEYDGYVPDADLYRLKYEKTEEGVIGKVASSVK